MTDPHWRENAQCRDLPWSALDLDAIPKAARHSSAARTCTGCPVITECREDTLANWTKTYNVVVAGVAVPDHGDTRGRNRACEAIRNGLFIVPGQPKPKPAPKVKNSHCTECRWPLVSNHTPTAKCPKGFRVRRMHGLCHVCAKKAPRSRPLVHQKCADCDETLRPSGRTEADFPGTSVHQGGGLCRRCYFRARRRIARAAAA